MAKVESVRIEFTSGAVAVIDIDGDATFENIDTFFSPETLEFVQKQIVAILTYQESVE